MIVVTGGAGFIGSNIVAALEQQNYTDIVVVDLLGSDDKWKNLAKRKFITIIPPRDTFTFLEANQDQIDAIIHMGAISQTTETGVDLILRNNVDFSIKLWSFCCTHQKRLIYASSAATYGDGALGFDDDNDLAALNALRPLNPYGWSKALFDRKVATDVARGVRPKQYVGLKFFNVYGPNEYHKGEQQSVIAHLFPLVKNNKKVHLFKSYHPQYKDGQQQRDFVWVGDVVSVVCWLLENVQVNGIFNVGSGEARSFYDLTCAVWHAVNLKPKIGFKPMPESLRDKYQYYTKANLTRLRQAGFTKPTTSLEEGARKYVQQFLMQSDPYL